MLCHLTGPVLLRFYNREGAVPVFYYSNGHKYIFLFPISLSVLQRASGGVNLQVQCRLKIGDLRACVITEEDISP